MRTFLALELPEDFKSDLIRLIEDFCNYSAHGVKWVEPQNLHITLQFIGDTRNEDLQDLASYFGQIFIDTPKLIFFDPVLEIIPGKFPRIIWIEMKSASNNIFKISKLIRNKLQELHCNIDRKPLKLHCTLGRVKKKLPEILISKILTTEIAKKTIEISRATFYQSILRQEGPIYECIETYNLKEE
ncbi:MAG: RNA 2',3'-cyclic phosphodiesterase [Candidatus Cloacimonetes bacterium]|nr:RNA 2',3'-cyclic phosphodiesterase [Candidatus Cloacimonadota bacterium]